MTAITVTSTDWDILEDVQEALSGATIDGQAAFAAVTAATGDPQAEQCQFTASPAVIVLYRGTTRHPAPGGQVGCVLELELLLAAKASGGGTDESARLKELLGHFGAARAAVEASPPADAAGWSDGRTNTPAVAFAPPQVDASHSRPWVVGRMGLSVAYGLDAATGAPPVEPPYQIFRRISDVVLDGVDLPGAVSVRLVRRRDPVRAAGDAELYDTLVTAGPAAVSGTIACLDPAAAATAWGLEGTLSFVWHDDAGGDDRTVTVANVAALDWDAAVHDDKAPAVSVAFQAASSDGVTAPVTIT